MASLFTTSTGDFASQPQPPDPESLQTTGLDCISLPNLSPPDNDPQSLCRWCGGLGQTLGYFPDICGLYYPQLYQHTIERTDYDYRSQWQTAQDCVTDNLLSVETSSQAGGYSLVVEPLSVSTAVDGADSAITYQNAQIDQLNHDIHSYQNPASIRQSSRLQERYYTCCNYMSKEMLQGPLPSDDQTQAHLCEELGLPVNTKISLNLNEHLRASQPSRSRASSWTASVRIACLLAIWGSERRELTTNEILRALIDAIPYCHEHRHHANTESSGKKRGGWVATVVSTLSTSTIFVQKTPDGLRSKRWRLDVRGLNNCVRVCVHNKERFKNATSLSRIAG